MRITLIACLLAVARTQLNFLSCARLCKYVIDPQKWIKNCDCSDEISMPDDDTATIEAGLHFGLRDENIYHEPTDLYLRHFSYRNPPFYIINPTVKLKIEAPADYSKADVNSDKKTYIDVNNVTLAPKRKKNNMDTQDLNATDVKILPQEVLTNSDRLLEKDFSDCVGFYLSNLNNNYGTHLMENMKHTLYKELFTKIEEKCFRQVSQPVKREQYKTKINMSHENTTYVDKNQAKIQNVSTKSLKYYSRGKYPVLPNKGNKMIHISYTTASSIENENIIPLNLGFRNKSNDYRFPGALQLNKTSGKKSIPNKFLYHDNLNTYNWLGNIIPAEKNYKPNEIHKAGKREQTTSITYTDVNNVYSTNRKNLEKRPRNSRVDRVSTAKYKPKTKKSLSKVYNISVPGANSYFINNGTMDPIPYNTSMENISKTKHNSLNETVLSRDATVEQDAYIEVANANRIENINIKGVTITLRNKTLNVSEVIKNDTSSFQGKIMQSRDTAKDIDLDLAGQMNKKNLQAEENEIENLQTTLVPHKRSNETIKQSESYSQPESSLSKIITKEFENDTVITNLNSSNIEEHEILDLVQNLLVTNNYINITPINKKTHNELISGNMFFLFDKFNIPARFIQNKKGDISLGIDGAAFCDGLNFIEKESIMLKKICNLFKTELGSTD